MFSNGLSCLQFVVYFQTYHCFCLHYLIPLLLMFSLNKLTSSPQMLRYAFKTTIFCGLRRWLLMCLGNQHAEFFGKFTEYGSWNSLSKVSSNAFLAEQKEKTMYSSSQNA